MRSIKGSDIRFRSGLSGPVENPDIQQLSHASHLVKALTSLDVAKALLKSTPPPIDQLDTAFLEGKLDRHLAARALIEAGKVSAHPLAKCEDRFFSFETSETECPGFKRDSVRLAEQVDVTYSQLNQPFVIELRPDGSDSITLEPEDPNQPVTVEIQNDIDALRKNPNISACVMQKHYDHYNAYRWFYLLAPEAVRNDVEHHYRPCKKGHFGPPKCPMRLLFIKKDRES